LDNMFISLSTGFYHIIMICKKQFIIENLGIRKIKKC